MDLVTGAIGSLAPKLLRLLRKEYKLQTEVEKQVKSLSLELESIYAALRKVAEVPWDQLDEQVKLWAREVRESSYDMEDVLDTFLVRVDSHEPADTSRLRHALKKMGDLFSKGKARRDIAGAIEDIKKQLQEVAERRARYKIDEIFAKPVTAASTIDPRLAAMYKEMTQLVGIEISRDKLMSILKSSQGDDDVSSNKIMKMVSVVGVGGLGKTTLAKVVYEKLQGNFTFGAFVPVGRNPDFKKVFRNILIDLDKQHYMENLNMTTLDERQLIDAIRELLKDNRYFIVIDDIWEPRSWEIIKLALVENNCGSRVITTTRNLEIAKDAAEFYRLQPLSYDESKKLLYARILSGGKENNLVDNQLDDHDEFVDKILNKCDGIPLAIITMASLLVDKPREEWPELYTAIGFGNKDNRHIENTMRILSFSYYDLPSHLRTCLLYLSAFPEDYVIDKDSLIWMWIAEGFVHKKQGKGLFELGEGYFNDLISRSMIQAVESQFYSSVEGCRVHDMVLDLIRSLSHEVNFVVTLNDVEGTSSQNRVRRVAQNGTTCDITLTANYMDMAHVRSYIVCRCDISQWIPLRNFKLLRVLFLQNCLSSDVHCHLDNLGHLHHLRYLGLRGPDIRGLPKQIQHLKFLQTLDVMESRIQELPACVIQLTNLMCLRCDSWFTSVPDGIGKLTFLEVLQVRVGSDDMSKRRFAEELGSLRELRVLETTIGFIDEGMERVFVESLHNLCKIQHLSLLPESPIINADVATWEAAGFVLPQHLRHLRLHNIRFSRLPSCINLFHLHNLTFLGLLVDTMDEQDMTLLGTLPELLFLSLKMWSTVTMSNINATDGYFLKLRFLEMPASMVQFQRNKEDLTVSFHTWNGLVAAPFGSREYDCSCAPSVVMPNLQVLRMVVFVRALKDGNIDYGNIIGLEYLGLLQDGFLWIDCEGASTANVQEAEAALWNAIDVHPNRPTLRMPRWNEDKMISSVHDQDLEHDKEYDDDDEEEEEEEWEEEEMVMSS